MAQLVCPAQLLQQLDEPERGIGKERHSPLRDGDPLAHRSLEGVVQVVPALPERDQRHPTIVAAGITGRKRLVADQMGHRIDAGHGMKQHRRAEAERPQALDAAEPPRQPGQGDGRQHVQPIDQPQHRIGFHIRRQRLRVEARPQQPAQLGMPEPAPAGHRPQRRMGVAGGVDMAVVPLVVGLPPAGPHLARRGGHHRAQPPHRPGGAVAAMGDQPVVDRRGRQHAQPVQQQGPQGHPQPQAARQQQQAAQMAEDDEHRAKPMENAASRQRQGLNGAEMGQG